MSDSVFLAIALVIVLEFAAAGITWLRLKFRAWRGAQEAQDVQARFQGIVEGFGGKP